MAVLGDVSLNTQNRYEGGTIPSLEYLLRIGEAGADWFWIATGRRTADTLSAEESELVDRFRSVSFTAREAVLAILRCVPADPQAGVQIYDPEAGAGEFVSRAALHDGTPGFKAEGE